MTNAKVITLTAALRASNTEHRVFEQVEGSGDWFVQASPKVMYTAAQIQALADTHVVTGKTNRVEFN